MLLSLPVDKMQTDSMGGHSSTTQSLFQMLAFMKIHSRLSLWIFLKAWCLGKNAVGLPIVHLRDHNMQLSIFFACGKT